MLYNKITDIFYKCRPAILCLHKCLHSPKPLPFTSQPAQLRKFTSHSCTASQSRRITVGSFVWILKVSRLLTGRSRIVHIVPLISIVFISTEKHFLGRELHKLAKQPFLSVKEHGIMLSCPLTWVINKYPLKAFTHTLTYYIWSQPTRECNGFMCWKIGSYIKSVFSKPLTLGVLHH